MRRRRRISLPFLLALVLLAPGCGPSCPPAAPAAKVCQRGAVPVGRWTGQWESYPLSNSNFVRAGSIDLVIGRGGSLSGYTVEESNLDRGSIKGSTKSSGDFSAEYVVRRQGKARKYALTGSFVCEGESIAGMGVVTWGQEQRGNLKFRLQEAP